MKNQLATHLVYGLLITLFLNSCIPDEEELLYPGFATITVQSVGNQTKPVFQITGEITQIKEGVTLSDYGIVFMDTPLDTYKGITLDNADYVSSLGVLNSAGMFTLNVDIQAGDIGAIVLQGDNVSYRAFATFDGKTVYSEDAYSFKYSASVTASISAATAGVDRAQIAYSIEGNDISQYGICWSNETGVVPTVDNSNIINTGTPPSRDGGLTINLNQLEKAKTYAVRAYGIDSDNNVYYSEKRSFNTSTSGWQWGPTDLATTTATGLVSFSIGNIGYFGLGVNGSTANLNCWQYNVETDSITAIADFPGEGRINPVAFTIGDKAYVGLGRKFDDGTPLSDFWEYEQISNTWTQVADYAGETRFSESQLRQYPAVFATDNYGYVGLGKDENKQLTSSFMRYEPTTNSWAAIEPYPEGTATGVFGGSIGNFGIVGLGENETGLLSSYWGYDEQNNNWVEIPSASTLRPTVYIGYKVNDRQFLFGTGTGFTIPLHVEYVTSTSTWEVQGIPFLLSEEPDYLDKTDKIARFELADRVVFFRYDEGSSLEYIPTN